MPGGTDAGARADGLTGADILGQALADAGCTHAFGIPGGEVLALIEGLDKAGIRFVLTKHENAAGFMAEGVWHAMSRNTSSGSAAPGLLVATLGPGVANAINVVANAMQDRVPLLFLTGRVPAAAAESYTHQVFDHAALLRPIVKGSFEARPGTVGLVVQKALALATDGQPGPVHLDLPIDVMEGLAADGDRAIPVPPRAITRPAASPTLDAALDAFAAAERPLVLAGVDAVNQGACPALAAFCQAHGVPLVTSYKAKGLLDETHPLCLGAAGLSPKADGILLPLIAQADAILLAGYDPIEMRVGWRHPWAEDATVIDVTPALRDHGMHRVSLTIEVPLAGTLDLVAQRMADCERWQDGAIASAKDALAQAFAPEDGFGPATVFHTLSETLPDDTIATADSGAHRILASHVWRARGPRGMLQSSALCTMGCAVPLAAGHRLVDQRPAIAFVGDAGLEMGLGELATLRDLKLPVLVCVLVDESLALIEKKQRSSQRPNLGVDFDGSDFPAIAKAMGGHGVWIDDVETLAREAQDALARETFTVLACRIGRRAYDGKI